MGRTPNCHHASSSKPHPSLPQGEGAPPQPPQTQQEGTPAPWGGHGEGLTQAAATLTELRFPSPGLRAKHATLGKRPTNLATLQELRLAVGVTRSRIMGRNGEVVIIRLSITPSANRNTYSVATLIIHIPRVEALRTSTLGYKIATPTELPGVRTIQHGSPIPALPRGRSTTQPPQTQ